MNNNEPRTLRELGAIELDQVSGGGCQCGNNSPCVEKGTDGHWYTCGGLRLQVGPGGR